MPRAEDAAERARSKGPLKRKKKRKKKSPPPSQWENLNSRAWLNTESSGRGHSFSEFPFAVQLLVFVPSACVASDISGWRSLSPNQHGDIGPGAVGPL